MTRSTLNVRNLKLVLQLSTTSTSAKLVFKREKGTREKTALKNCESSENIKPAEVIETFGTEGEIAKGYRTEQTVWV